VSSGLASGVLDTAFHRTMPPVAGGLPISRRCRGEGVERYGLRPPYGNMMGELRRLDPVAATGRSDPAHLGKRTKIGAVRHGQSVGHRMGLHSPQQAGAAHPNGRLDPGLAILLERAERMTLTRFQRMVNQESAARVSGPKIDCAICAQVRPPSARAEAVNSLKPGQKADRVHSQPCSGIGYVVFAAGSAQMLHRSARGILRIRFLGIQLDRMKCKKSTADLARCRPRPRCVLLSPRSVKVRVIRTDEELMIARIPCPAYQLGSVNG